MGRDDHQISVSKILARMISDNQDIRRYSQASNLKNVNYSGTPETIWHNILREAINQEKLIDLKNALIHDYSKLNEPFEQLESALKSQVKNGEKEEKNKKDEFLLIKGPVNKVWKWILVAFVTLSVISAVGYFWFFKLGESESVEFIKRRPQLDYKIKLSTTTDSESSLDTLLTKSDKYLIIKADLDYTQIPEISNQEDLVVAIALYGKEYEKWWKRGNVVYREIIGLDSVDYEWILQLTSKIDRLSSAEQKKEISRFFSCDINVNGKEAKFSHIVREAGGFAAYYKNPAKGDELDETRLSFRTETIQLRNQSNFPAIIPELTKNILIRIDFKDAELENPKFYSSFLSADDRAQTRVTFEKNDGILEVITTQDKWVYPGATLFLYWND